MVMKAAPEHIRSDNGPEFVAKDLRKWLADTGAKTLYIEPGSRWEMLRITKVRPNILTINLRFRHTTTLEQCQESRKLPDIEALLVSGTDEGNAKISFDFIV